MTTYLAAIRSKYLALIDANKAEVIAAANADLHAVEATPTVVVTDTEKAVGTVVEDVKQGL